MSGLSDSINPPYYAATMETHYHLSSDNSIVWPDVMIPLATRQSGFLGLETTNDNKGRSIIISYWRNNSDIEHWKSASLVAHSTRYSLNKKDTDYSWIKVNKVQKKSVKKFSLSTFFLQTKFKKYQI